MQKSPTSQDGFQPIPGLSCAGITERWGLVSECSQVAGFILNVMSVEAFRKAHSFMQLMVKQSLFFLNCQVPQHQGLNSHVFFSVSDLA